MGSGGRVKIVVYSRPHFLDPTLPLACELAREHRVHLFVEIAPESEPSAIFEAGIGTRHAGVQRWSPSLHRGGGLPSGLRDLMGRLAGVYLVVHRSRRALSLRTSRTAIHAARTIARLAPDLLHVDEFSARLLPVLYGLPRLPVVASLHDVQEHPGEETRSFQKVRRFGLRRTHAVIVHSEHSREAFRMRAPGRLVLRTHVVPLGCYDLVENWDEGTTSEQYPTVLLWGRLSAYKGLDVFIDAARLVAERISGVRFVIAGRPASGYTLPPLPPLSGEGTFDVRARYIDCLETCRLFRGSSVVVLPYRQASQSGVVAMAYAFSKPVVATRVGGLGEAVLDRVTGRLVAPESAAELSSAIIELLLDPEKRAQMAGEISRRASGDWSWRSLAKRTLEVYESVARTS